MKQLLTASLLLLSAQAFAQPAAGPYARMVVIQPKPGQATAFEQGYQRHLEWHSKAADRWTWYGWSFVLGERLGMFMDGTFGHAAANFDAAMQPAADAADNAANVVPYADFLSHGVFCRLDAASVGQPLPDTSPFLAMTTYTVAAGDEGAFERQLEAGATRPGAGPARTPGGASRFTWYKLQIGGRPTVCFDACSAILRRSGGVAGSGAAWRPGDGAQRAYGAAALPRRDELRT
ncbi:hypothetical protein GM658_24045 [Pseudoduganella eburnea]|uniref:Uncharacterized protein n=1 Tax=Massilia eburnea TaxID=1776165 RepID=A0A6L6QP63_9BURK|nr:hypothetical protein [Massilia eburnea]MTW13687.1 hypothetical protein [Massilia eburnea]